MKKKIILILSLVLILLISAVSFTAYNQYHEYLHSEITVKYNYYDPPYAIYHDDFYKLTSEEKFHATIISESTCAIIGKFNYVKHEEDLYKFNFDVKTVVYGEVNVEDKNIDVAVISWQSEFYKENTFKSGEEYLLFLIEDDIVFLDEPQYGFTGQTLIPINNLSKAKWNEEGKLIYSENTNYVNIAEFYKNFATEKGYNENAYEETIIRNQSLDTVINESEVVLRFKVLYKVEDSILWPATLYQVEKIECLKGEEYLYNGSGQYIIRAAKNSLKIDEEYIMTFGLVDPTRTNSFLLQSALNGVVPIEDTETVEKVYEWLDLK